MMGAEDGRRASRPGGRPDSHGRRGGEERDQMGRVLNSYMDGGTFPRKAHPGQFRVLVQESAVGGGPHLSRLNLSS